MLVGDNVLIVKTASGEKVACPRHAASLDPLKPGDKVVITPRADGTKDCCLVSPLNVGDKVAINQLQNGEKIALKLTEQFNQSIQVPLGYGVTTQVVAGTPLNLGTYNFKWDGETPVYFRGATGGMAWEFTGHFVFYAVARDIMSIRITTAQGTLTTPINVDGGFPFHYPEANDIEITSIMKRGDNKVQIQLETTTTTTFQIVSYMFITVQNVGAAVTAD